MPQIRTNFLQLLNLHLTIDHLLLLDLEQLIQMLELLRQTLKREVVVTRYDYLVLVGKRS